MAKRDISMKEAASELGVSAKWIRARIAEGAIRPRRAGGKGSGRYLLSEDELATLGALANRTAAASGASAAPASVASGDEGAAVTDTLARISRLEADRANLLAQVAWERAIAQEQQKALEIERERVEKLLAELDVQRARIERLKALGAWDRIMGRHKEI